jgi:protein-tyrosine phosphatase
MIDIHHHIIYGVDDGPSDAETMRKMLEAASRDGIRTLIATSHIAPGIEHFPMNQYYERLLEAQTLCGTLALDLRVLAGSEIRYTHQTAARLAEGSIPTLAGTNKVLLEFQGNVRFEAIEEAVQAVLRNAAVPIIAHIERFPHLIHPVRHAKALKEKYEVYYQINSECFLKSHPGQINRSIRHLLKQGMIDFVASDTHDCDDRRCRMTETYEKLVQMVGREYADKLTGKHATADEFLGRVDEQAIRNCVRIDRQKSQLRNDEHNIR